MWEYEVLHKSGKYRTIIFGHSFTDACERHGLNPNDFRILISVYAD